MKKINKTAFLALLCLGCAMPLMGQQIIEEGWPYYFKTCSHYTWQSNAWQKDMKMTPVYNASKHITMVAVQVQNGANWDTVMKMIMTYDGSNRPYTRAQKVWTGSAWMANNADTFSYAGGRTDTRISWKLVSGKMVRNNLYHYQYTAANVLKGILAEDISTTTGNWENDDYYYYFYNGSGNITRILDHNWDGTKFYPAHQSIMSFNANGTVSEQLKQDSSPAGWVNTEKFVFDSSYKLAIIEPKAPGTSLKLFPNPVNDELTLQCAESENITCVSVYNSEGKMVYQYMITGQPLNEIKIQTNTLPRGIYLLQAHGSSGAGHMKFIKE